jgi:non-ribosomal peptide synthase protein (TIGR01720 family)
MLYLALEDHGRRTPLDGVNALGTIGWFTAVYPFRLQLGATDTLSRLRETGEALAAVPGRGLGYGLLRYMNEAPDVRGMMERVPEPGVAFNFLGHLRPDADQGNLLRIAGDPFELLVPGQARRFWPLQVEALIMDGRLRIRWNGLRDVLGDVQATGLVSRFEKQLVDIARCLE